MTKHFRNRFDILFIDNPLSLNERYSPLAFEMLSSFLEAKGLHCGILGVYNRNIASVSNIPTDYVLEQLKGKEFRMVGITLCGFDMISPSHELALKIKAHFPEVKIVVGGFFTTFYPKEILENNPGFDYLIVGDGEQPLWQLLTTTEGDIPSAGISGLAYRNLTKSEIIYTPAGKQLDMEMSPAPTTSFSTEMVKAFGRDVAIGGLCTSKGCRYNCSFCSVAETSNLLSHQHRRRALSAEKTLGRIKSLVEAGIRVIRVVDTDFIGGNPARAVAIAKGILDNEWDINLFIDVCFADLDEDLFRLLAKAGFNGLVGIESLSYDDRKLFRKILISKEKIYAKMEAIERTGFHLYSSFILYNPQTTLDDLELNLAFIRRFRKSFKCKTFFTYLRVDKNPFLSNYLEDRGALGEKQAERFRSLNDIQENVETENLDRLQLLLPYSLELVPQFQDDKTHFVFHSMYHLLYWAWFYQFRLILYHNMDRSCFLNAPPTEDAESFLSDSDALFDLCADTMQELIDRARRNNFEISDLEENCERRRAYWKVYVEQEARLENKDPFITVEA